MRNPDLMLRWNVPALSASMHLTPEEVLSYFRDGRRISFILERRIRDSFPGWKLAPSEGSAYDLIDTRGRFWEVRSLSTGIYFSPSGMVGSGRSFDEVGFLAKLDSVAGYVCSDIIKFPEVPVYVVPCELIRSLYNERKLGRNTRITSRVFYSTIVPALEKAS